MEHWKENSTLENAALAMRKQHFGNHFIEHFHQVSLTKQCELMCVYRDLFPSSRVLFMYRDIMAAAKSYHRVSMVVPKFPVLFVFEGKTIYFMKPLAEHHGVDFSAVCRPMHSDNNLLLCVLLVALSIASYLKMRRHGFDVSALRYEDLVARPLDMCRVVLEFCHLPVSLAELAVKAFDVDSHANSASPNSAIGHLKEPQLTREIKTKLNEILRKCGVPLIGEPNTIEGTLSC